MKRFITVFEILMCIGMLVEVKTAWGGITLVRTTLSDDQVAVIQAVSQQMASKDLKVALDHLQDALINYEDATSPKNQPITNYYKLLKSHKKHTAVLAKLLTKRNEYLTELNKYLEAKVRDQNLDNIDKNIQAFKERLALYDEQPSPEETKIRNHYQTLLNKGEKDRTQYLATRISDYLKKNGEVGGKQLKTFDQRILNLNTLITKYSKLIAEVVNHDKQIKNQEIRDSLKNALSKFLYLHKLKWKKSEDSPEFPWISTVKELTIQILTAKTDADRLNILLQQKKNRSLVPVQLNDEIIKKYAAYEKRNQARNQVLLHATKFGVPELEKKWAKKIGPRLAKKRMKQWVQELTQIATPAVTQHVKIWTKELTQQAMQVLQESEEKSQPKTAQREIQKWVQKSVEKRTQHMVEKLAIEWAQQTQEQEQEWTAMWEKRRGFTWLEEWKTELEELRQLGLTQGEGAMGQEIESALSTGHSGYTPCSEKGLLQ